MISVNQPLSEKRHVVVNVVSPTSAVYFFVSTCLFFRLVNFDIPNSLKDVFNFNSEIISTCFGKDSLVLHARQWSLKKTYVVPFFSSWNDRSNCKFEPHVRKQIFLLMVIVEKLKDMSVLPVLPMCVWLDVFRYCADFKHCRPLYLTD